MLSKKILVIILSLIVITSFLVACSGPQPQTVEEPGVEAEQTAPEKPQIEKVNIGFIYCGPMDEPWSQAMITAVERVKANNPPQGLTVNYKYFEKVPVDEYEKFIRNVLDSREFDIVWIHDACAGTDPIDKIRADYPDELFPVTASNYFPVGGNTYWIQPYAHEPAYLCGVIAGLMTETDTLGIVAGFPYASVNHLLNAFIAGAKSVNPNVKVKNAYIESWWDPVKAKETALAQIEAGADLIYAERYGGHEAAREKGIYAFGSQSDIHDLAPDTVISSALFYWDPSIRAMIELWYDHKVNGTPYNAPADRPTSFLMKDGGSGLAPLYNFETTLPKDVLDKLNADKQAIMDGTLTVPLVLDAVTSD
jgi:basic membrane protein A and related proteins